MSDAFDEITGPAGLNEDDATEIAVIDDDEVIVDDDIPVVEDVLPEEDDGSLGEKDEETEDAELFNEYLFGDDANAF